jgi:hypothetical protein
MTARDFFFAALDLATPEEWAAYLDGACGQDLALRRRVEKLGEGGFGLVYIELVPLVAHFGSWHSEVYRFILWRLWLCFIYVGSEGWQAKPVDV